MLTQTMLRRALVIIALSATACSTPRATSALREQALGAVRSGDLATAAATFNKLYDSNQPGEPTAPGRKPSAQGGISGKQGLLWRFERGLLAFLGGDYPAAIAHAHDACRRVEALRAADLVAGTVSAFANDTVRDYVGQGYEHNYANYTWALGELLIGQARAGRYWPRQVLRVPGAPPAPPPAAGTQEPLPAFLTDEIETLERFDRALTAIRHLTEVQGKRTGLLADGEHYAGSSFLWAMGAAMVLAHPWRDSDDLAYAQACLDNAEKLRADHQKRYPGQKAWRYETDSDGALIASLKTWVAENPARTQAGRAAILVVHQVGFAAKPEVLDIRLATITDSSRAKADRFNIGALVFWADGPGSEQVEEFGALPMPAVVAQKLAPGGLSVMGFAIPVHLADSAIGVRASVTVDTQTEGLPPQGQRVDLGVVCDLDAYARAQLKDQQKQVVLKTFTRAALKQIAAGVAASAARKEGGELAGALTNLVGSFAMTVSEVADTRACTLIPDHIEAALVEVPAGRTRVRLTAGGNEYDLGEAVLPAGALVVVPVATAPQPIIPPGTTRTPPRKSH